MNLKPKNGYNVTKKGAEKAACAIFQILEGDPLKINVVCSTQRNTSNLIGLPV